jgi:hypothetical protein
MTRRNYVRSKTGVSANGKHSVYFLFFIYVLRQLIFFLKGLLLRTSKMPEDVIIYRTLSAMPQTSKSLGRIPTIQKWENSTKQLWIAL